MAMTSHCSNEETDRPSAEGQPMKSQPAHNRRKKESDAETNPNNNNKKIQILNSLI